MELTVQKREVFGKAARGVRKAGEIPAELYGRGIANAHLAVPAPEFLKVLKEAGMSTVLRLKIGEETHPVIVHDIQRDFITGAVQHVDFYQVRMDEKMKARVPLEFSGESPAVKAGAILIKSLAEVEVEALPADLPHRLIVDLSLLDALGKSVYVKDLAVPSGVRLIADEETAVATVQEAKEEVVEAAPADVSAVKVETEEKKEERAAEKAVEEKEK
jgi:large subunit ribosomal protein L25